MLRGGLQDFPSPSTSRRAQQKKQGKRYKGKVSISHRSCTGIQIHRHWRFHHQFPGGLDHELYQMRRFRISEAWVQSESALHIPLHTSISKGCPECTTECTTRSLTLIWSLPGHLQSQGPGKDRTCTLMQCFLHDDTVCKHS